MGRVSTMIGCSTIVSMMRSSPTSSIGPRNGSIGTVSTMGAISCTQSEIDPVMATLPPKLCCGTKVSALPTIMPGAGAT